MARSNGLGDGIGYFCDSDRRRTSLVDIARRHFRRRLVGERGTHARRNSFYPIVEAAHMRATDGPFRVGGYRDLMV